MVDPAAIERGPNRRQQQMIVQTLALGPAQTNCYLVGAEPSREAVVIDPGWNADAIFAEARSARSDDQGDSLDARPLRSHRRGGGYARGDRAPLIAHPLELDLLDANGGADLFGFKIRSVPRPIGWWHTAT